MKCLVVIYSNATDKVFTEYGFSGYIQKRYKNIIAQDNIGMCVIANIERSWKHFWYSLIRKETVSER